METILRRLTEQPGLRLSVGYVDAEGRRHEGDLSAPDAMRHADGLLDAFAWEETEEGLVVDRRVTNDGDRVLRVKELFVRLEGVAFGRPPEGHFFYHAENPRIYGKMAIPVSAKRGPEAALSGEADALAGNRWADPGVAVERIGASPYQPFPALLAGHCDAPSALVHGTLSQRVFYHAYLLENRPDGLRWDLFSAFKAVAYRELRPGETLLDRWYLGVCDTPGDLDRIFARYTRALRRVLSGNRGRGRVNRDTLVWGSWNDGFFRDVDRDKLLAIAPEVKRDIPKAEWFQLDDGYARVATDHNTAHGLGMPYEGDAGLDRDKFPGGLGEYARAVRREGLRPAVWIGGSIPGAAPLAREKPAWMIDYRLRLGDRVALDPSRPDVRAYIERALDYFLRENAFEGVKLDFWSYAFEDSGDLLRDKSRSGYEWRTWFLQEIVRRLPEDGYLQSGCDIAMGNPFLGEFFTNYRYGIDVGHGQWENVLANLLWGAACFATHTGDLAVPNSDSVGLLPGLDDTEFLFVLSHALITRSMVEVAGRWGDAPADGPRRRHLRRACACVNNGQDAFLLGYDYRATDEPPWGYYLETGHFTRRRDHPAFPLRCVALLNAGAAPRRLSFTPEALGLPPGAYWATEIWTGRADPVEGAVAADLPPHGAAVYHVNRAEGFQVLNADREVLDVDAAGVRLAGDGAFELLTLEDGRPRRHVGHGRVAPR